MAGGSNEAVSSAERCFISSTFKVEAPSGPAGLGGPGALPGYCWQASMCVLPFSMVSVTLGSRGRPWGHGVWGDVPGGPDGWRRARVPTPGSGGIPPACDLETWAPVPGTPHTFSEPLFPCLRNGTRGINSALPGVKARGAPRHVPTSLSMACGRA